MTTQRRTGAAGPSDASPYRALFDELPNAVIAIGPDRRIWFANAAVEQLMGWPPEALVGQDVSLLQSAALDHEASSATGALPSATQPRGRRAIETRCLHRDGRAVPVEITFSTVRIDEQPVRVGIIREVGARHAAHRLTRLYSALSQVNETIARSTDPIVMLQAVCDIVVQQTGITAAMVSQLDAAATRLDDIAYAGEFSSVFSHSHVPVGASSPGDESPGSLVVRTRRPHVSADRHEDASVRPIMPLAARAALRSSAVFPLHRQGVVFGVFAVYAREPSFFDADLTALLDLLARHLSYSLDAFAARERRDIAESALKRLNATLEERVAQRTRSLEAANRELEAFSYSVSHDLRAPLRGIAGFSQLLHDGYAQQLDDTGRHYLDRVKAAAAKMGRLIEDLLGLSRIARQAIRRTEVDISALAAEIVDELREAEPARSVAVSIEPGLAAHADSGLARIALANLIENAWKFTSQRQAARIEITSTVMDGRAGFIVRDNGAGFDAEFAQNLFAPFQRLHSDREFEGTGIGLAIVQRIVHRHGGDVRVDAAADQGAAFSVTLGSRVGANSRCYSVEVSDDDESRL